MFDFWRGLRSFFGSTTNGVRGVERKGASKYRRNRYKQVTASWRVDKVQALKYDMFTSVEDIRIAKERLADDGIWHTGAEAIKRLESLDVS